MNQNLSYLDFMKLLLDNGANPNVRLTKKVWYSGYNFDQSGVDEVGATPCWRAAYGSDIEAMKLLVQFGADPAIPTVKPAGRPQTGDAGDRDVKDVSGLPAVPIGGPAVPPLLAAAVSDTAKALRPTRTSSRRAACSPRSNIWSKSCTQTSTRATTKATPPSTMAARGDNETIVYLVSKGADPRAVNRAGQTTVDMANRAVQRVQPFPETIALLEKMGAKNNHRCLSC